MANEQNDFSSSMFVSAVQTPTAENIGFLFQLFSVTFVLRWKAGPSMA